MTEHIHGIFKFVNPQDQIALDQCIDAVDSCFYPWERCVPELEKESEGLVSVIWDDTGQGNTGMYFGSRDRVQNVIVLNNRYAGRNFSFTMLHEAGHMVDDTVLRDEQRKALVDKWHKDNDGKYAGKEDPNNPGEPHSWSHEDPHTHLTSYSDGGWRVNDDYQHRPNEAFADAFVAAFAPSYFPFKRTFTHWSDDIEGVRDIILSTPAPPPPPKVWLFPPDQIYRLYRAVFLREPDRGGYDYWKAKLAAGTTLHHIADGFTGSTEFRNRYGSMTHTQFVTLLYRNVLEREPDAGGLSHWVGYLNRGSSRGFILVNFSESQEFINKINNERK